MLCVSGVTRPFDLSSASSSSLSLSMKYDLKNVTALMRYLLPKPPVPVRWRRRMLALGSGD